MTARRNPFAPTKGELRRDDLVRVGVDIVVTEGWARLTARAVAERSGTHPGLVHHHFGGMPGLRREVAAVLLQDLYGVVLEAVTGAGSWQAGLAELLRTEPHGGWDGPGATVAADLVVAAMADTVIRGLLTDAQVDARYRLIGWLRSTGVTEDIVEGAAALVLAAAEGLLLHAAVDPSLRRDQVTAALEQV